MSFLRYLLIAGFVLATGFQADAKSSASLQMSSLSMMESKARLEQLITERYRDTISTSLDKAAFDVSVQVVLQAANSKKETLTLAKEKAALAADPNKLLDMTVGLVDADAIIEKYQHDIQDLKDRETILMKKNTSEDKSEFTIKSMNIMVGLQPSVSAEYTEKFRGWLKQKAAADFGSIVTSEVSILELAPSKKDKPKTTLDYLTDMQTLVGFALVAFAFIFAVLLLKLMTSKDSREMLKMHAQLQQSQSMRLQNEEAVSLEPKPDKKQELKPVSENAAFELDLMRELRSKIIWSSSENFERLNSVMQGWLESGERGLLKSACLMDVLITFGGQQSMPNGLPFEWAMAIPQNFRLKMRDVFSKMAHLQATVKIQILEEIYWDLVTIKVLGQNSLAQPFQFVSAIPASEMKTLLAAQNPRMRTLVVLHMQDDVRDEYIKRLTLDAKKEIFEQTIQMERVLNTDIETASEALKFEVKKGLGSDLQSVSLKSMAPKLLESMTVHDEIMLLKEISRTLSDGGISIKRSFPSLAFVGEWPDVKVKTVFKSATTDEVLTFLRIMPELREKFLPLCAPRVQEIVREDLKKEDSTSSEAKERSLGSLKLRLLQIINNENIDLEVIFPLLEKDHGGLRAAS